MSFKVAIIGAGSVGFTKTLISDLLKVPEFAIVEFALTDINEHNLDDPADHRRDRGGQQAAGQGHRDHRSARGHDRGARYIMSCVRVGGLEAFATDISHPAQIWRRPVRRRHHLRRRHPLWPAQHPGHPRFLQGYPRGRRAGRAVPQLCQPHGDEHLGGRSNMAASTSSASATACSMAPTRSPRCSASRTSELDYVCSGINHQTWYIDIRAKGRKIEADELIAGFEKHPVYSKQEKVRIDVLKRFGVYSTESNGHLSEYLPWYRKRPDEINRWIDMSDWIHGETGGYLRHSTERRNWFETDFPKFKEDATKPLSRAQADQRARQLHHRGAGDRAHLSRPLQPPQQRHHHQPAGRRHHREPRLRRSLRYQHGRRHRAADRLRRDLLGIGLGAALSASRRR
jgi:alpha-galactosidase